jgi:hypothetical protein
VDLLGLLKGLNQRAQTNEGKACCFSEVGFEMRVGYTRRRNPLSRESGVISKSFLFSYLKLYFSFILYINIYIYIVFRIKSNYMCLSHLLPLNNSRSQLCTFLEIFSFFQLKIVIIWYESPGCRYGSDTIFWIYGC